MTNHLPSGVIHVKDLYLWSHVGVLEQERKHGQEFLLDFSLWLNMEYASKRDNISSTADYSLGIRQLQHLALQLNCNTIEHFSELILDRLESIYGRIPMQVFLRKCSAPIPGFDGIVGVERSRYTYSAEK